MSQLLGIEAAARILNVHPQTLRRWELTGALVPDCRDSSRKRLYRSETIEKLLLEREEAGHDSQC